MSRMSPFSKGYQQLSRESHAIHTKQGAGNSRRGHKEVGIGSKESRRREGEGSNEEEVQCDPLVHVRDLVAGNRCHADNLGSMLALPHNAPLSHKGLDAGSQAIGRGAKLQRKTPWKNQRLRKREPENTRKLHLLASVSFLDLQKSN